MGTVSKNARSTTVDRGKPSSLLRFTYLTTACFFGLLGAAVRWKHLPLFVPVLYTSLSCLAFIAYGIDKRAAMRGRRRIPEKSLQMLALTGGWPGALLAQEVFRHKSRKPSYQWRLRGCVLLNGAALLTLYFYCDTTSRWFSGSI